MKGNLMAIIKYFNCLTFAWFSQHRTDYVGKLKVFGDDMRL